MLWEADTAADPYAMTPKRVLVAILRGVPLAIITFSCLGLLLLVRLIERPVYGLRRPITPHITQFVCRAAFVILGIKRVVRGREQINQGALVANHASWLDIFTLNASKRIYFVSKSEVASWPGIGWLARATGTVFIKRDPRQAADQKRAFQERLLAGHKLMFFPEGTSTDGLRVLPFKPTLFAAFFEPELKDVLYIQAVSTVYHAPQGYEDRFYGWWGDMDFAPHLLKTLAATPQGWVEVIYHEPLKVSDFANRKTLAAFVENQTREGLVQTLENARRLKA